MALKNQAAIEQAIKTGWAGDEEMFLADAKQGQKNRAYRKQRNMQQQALRYAVKANPEIKKRIDEELKRQTA